VSGVRSSWVTLETNAARRSLRANTPHNSPATAAIARASAAQPTPRAHRSGPAAPAATAGILTATADATGSSASVANATAINGIVPGFASLLTADVIESECAGSAGSASLLNADAAGNPLNAAPPANTVVPIPGVGSVTLNEQTVDSSGITVRAIHLDVAVGGIVIAEVVISESVCLGAIEALAAQATAADPNLTG